MKTILPAILTLIVGFAAGWLVFDQPSDELSLGSNTNEARPQTGANQAAQANQPKSESHLKDRASETPQPKQVEAASTLGETDVEAIIKNATAGTNIAPVEKGTGTITGTVKTKDGAPLAGVLIRATRRFPKNRSLPPTDGSLPDLSNFARELVVEELKTRAGMCEARSKLDGSFEVRGIVGNDDYRLEAFNKGYAFSGEIINREGSTWGVRDGDRVEFTASATVMVLLNVVNSPADEFCQVQFTRPGEKRHTLTHSLLNEPSSFPVETGEWSVQARTQVTLMASDAQTITIVAGENGQRIDMELKQAPGVRVLLSRTAPDDPRQGLAIGLREKDEKSGSSHYFPVSRKIEFEKDRISGVADFRHSHIVERLKTGTTYLVHLLGKEHSSKSIAELGEVTVDGSYQEVAFTIPAPDLDRFVTLEVRGPDGELVEVNGVTLHGIYANSSTRSYLEIPKPRDGVYELNFDLTTGGGSSGNREKDTELLEQKLEIRTGLGIHTHPFRFGQRKISITMEEPATLVAVIQGRTKGHGGNFSLSFSEPGTALGKGTEYPHAHTPSRAWSSGSSSETPQKVDSEPDRLVTEKMVPGRYLVRCSYSVSTGTSSSRITKQVFEQEVTLVSGENTIRVMAPVVGDVTVIDPDAKEGSEMRLQWTEARAGAGGIFVWKGVPEGEYEIRQSYGRYKSMKITVNGNTTIDFSPIQYNAMKVKITDTNGVLAKAGFRDGDYLIGIDGKTFENEEDMHTALQRAMYAERTPSFMVQRGRGKMTIAWKPSENMRNQEMGGDFDRAQRP